MSYGHVDEATMTADTSSLEPNVLEHEFYAKGSGPVLTIDVAGGGREELVTIDTAADGAGIGLLGPDP